MIERLSFEREMQDLGLMETERESALVRLQKVHDRWKNFSIEFEGFRNILYLDQKGLVTTGIGIWIEDPNDPKKPAHKSFCSNLFPFTHGWNGRPADCSDKVAAWNSLRDSLREYLADPTHKCDPRKPTGNSKKEQDDSCCGQRSDLRLSDDAVDRLFWAKTGPNEVQLRKEFPLYDDYPSDAQLGLLSMTWPGSFLTERYFPTFKGHVQNGHWFAAAKECSFSNPPLTKRNIANRTLFSLAGRVITMGLDADNLYYENKGANKCYFFKSNKYIRYDFDNDYIDASYPKDLALWNLPEPFSKGVDAAVSGLGQPKTPQYFGKTYFFKGKQYLRYDWDTDRVDISSMDIKDGWGLPEPFSSGIDAALNGEGKWLGKLYFFKGSKYIKWDWTNEMVDGGAYDIVDGWKLPGRFKGGIDAALSGEGGFSGRFYFFKDDIYIKGFWSPYRIDPNIHLIGEYWRGIDKYNFQKNINAAINAPGHPIISI